MNEDLTGGFRLQPDPDEVRAFCRLMHEQAARAFAGIADPGLLQLSRKHPAHGGLSVIGRYAIGESERMAADALIEASNGFNVYIEGRTVRRDLARTVRGENDDTRGVFALVIDSDADKGRQTRLDLAASLRVESSPGNAHLWLFFARALTIDQVAPHAEALRHATGADSATANPSQPYRLAGTPNFPDAKKRERGRIDTPTKVLEHTSHVWTLEDLQRIFPPVERVAPVGGRPQGGRDSIKVERILATTGGDRSERFYLATRTAFEQGLSAEEFEALCLKHPNGCAGRFATRGALRADITRIYGKASRGEQTPGKSPAVERVAPTYANNARPAHEGRALFRGELRKFVVEAEVRRRIADAFPPDKEKGHVAAAPIVRAVKFTTAGGKTHQIIDRIVMILKDARAQFRIDKIALFAPTTKLGDEILERFNNHDAFKESGLTVAIRRGREQDDPDQPGHKMCHDLGTTRDAVALGLPVKSSCCIGKKPDGSDALCPFFGTCGHSKQVATPDIVILSHQYLFQHVEEIKHVSHVFIDENFIKSGTKRAAAGLTFDEVEGFSDTAEMPQGLRSYRAMLGQALRLHSDATGLRREHLLAAGLTPDRCAEAAKWEDDLKHKRPVVYPGMSDDERKSAGQITAHNLYIRRRVALWNAARQLLADEQERPESGLAFIREETTPQGRVRVVKTQSLKSIASQWHVPTFIADATLPSLRRLQKFYPQVEIVADIEIENAPSVTVRQVTGAPVSKRALGLGHGSESAGRLNREELLAHVRGLYERFDRQSGLIIVPVDLEPWLKEQGFPKNIGIEHHNATAGLDKYRKVRWLLNCGGPIPKTQQVEHEAGLYTGFRPQPATIQGNGRPGWDRTTGGARLPDGSGRAVPRLTHPDEFVQELLEDIYAGAIMQNIGRGRGINRDAITPLHIEIMADAPLPVTVHEVVAWKEIKPERNPMLAAGWFINSPADMSTFWSQKWATRDAAKGWLNRPIISGSNPIKARDYIGTDPEMRREMTALKYRPAGKGQQMREAWVNLSICPDPRLWLEERLGPLAHFQIDEPPVVIDEGAEREREPSEPSRANQDAPAVIANRNPPVVDGPLPPPPR